MASPASPGRIARAVVKLVMVTDRLSDGAELEIGAEHLRTLDRVDTDLLHLVLGQGGQRPQDIGWRRPRADVVERGGDAEAESGPLWLAQVPRERVGVLDHPGRIPGHVGVQAARHHRHSPDRPPP